MSNAIGILEVIGRDASLRHATPGEIGFVLEGLQVGQEMRSAIVLNDYPRLQALLGATPNVFCGLHKDDEEEEEQPGGEDEIRRHSHAPGVVSAA